MLSKRVHAQSVWQSSPVIDFTSGSGHKWPGHAQRTWVLRGVDRVAADSFKTNVSALF